MNLELSTSKASTVDDESRERLFVTVFPEQLKALSLEALDAGMERPKAMQLNLGNFSFIEALLQNFNKSSSRVSPKNLFVSLSSNTIVLYLSTSCSSLLVPEMSYHSSNSSSMLNCCGIFEGGGAYV